MVMVSHAHQGHTRSRRRDEHHQMSMLVRDSLSWPWDAEKQISNQPPAGPPATIQTRVPVY